MLQAEQIAVTKRLFEYIDDDETAMTDSVYRQPVNEYIDKDVAEKEKDLFFRKTPICVGLSNLLPQPGSYLTHDLSGQPLLLTRNNSGKFQCFLNVCRHRGARIAEGCGEKRSFSCPYHAWTYDIEGKLIARPEEKSFETIEPSLSSLTSLPALEKNGLLWVIPTPAGEPDLDGHLEGISADLAGFSLSGFHHYESRILTRKMNWKLLLDTFLESYHFCVLHKNTICSIFYDNLQTFDTWGRHFRLVSPRRTIEKLRQTKNEEIELLPHMVGIYVLFPNTVLVWQLDHIELWQIFPTENAPDESCVQVSLYTPEPSETPEADRHWKANMDLVVNVVENEDFPVGEGIQKSFYSGAQNEIVFGLNEPALAFFHEKITSSLKASL